MRPPLKRATTQCRRPWDAAPPVHRADVRRPRTDHRLGTRARHGATVRIAIVTESYEPTDSAVGTVVRQVLAQLSAASQDVLLIAPGRGPTTSAGFPVVRVGAVCAPVRNGSPRVGLPVVRRVEAIFREFDPDVVLLAAPVVLGATGAVAAHRIGVDSVAVLTADQAAAGIDRRRGWTAHARDRWTRRVLARTARTLVPSDRARISLAAQGFLGVETWSPGVDLERFTPRHRAAALRATLGSPRRMLVGYAGTDPRRAVALLPSIAAVPDARLVTVGPTSAELRRRTPSAAHLGTLGDDLPDVLASLDILVSGGDHSADAGMLAALASGVPVVAPSQGDTPDLVRHGYNGLLVTPGTARAIAHATALLVRDHGLRSAMAERARPSVADRSWRASTLQLLGHLRQVAGMPDPAADREILAA